MDTPQNIHTNIRADRKIIDELAVHGLISASARDYALNLLYPAHNWGIWITRLLLVLSIALVLSGIVFFFAFNWSKISPIFKLSIVQSFIFAFLLTAYWCGLHRTSGKIMLFIACFLVGVFFAVFGQIYQTGADAHTFFMMWALLILPFVTIGESGALWIMWIIVSNLSASLYWLHDGKMIGNVYLMLFNIGILIVRELLAYYKVHWLKQTWGRLILVSIILTCGIIPTLTLIFSKELNVSYATQLGTMLTAITHIVFYISYRYKSIDMWALMVTIGSGCIILCAILYRILIDTMGIDNALVYLIMGGFIIALATLVIQKMHHGYQLMEKKDV